MRSTRGWWQKWQEKQDGCQNWSPSRDAEIPGSPLFSLLPHCKAEGRVVWGQAGFQGWVPGGNGCCLVPGEGMPHLLAGTAMAGTRHGTCQPLPQGLPSPSGAECS